MPDTSPPIEITFRIPGTWAHPGELVDRLPEGYRLSHDGLILPDGQQIEFNPVQPDAQFADIFASSCRRPATRDELGRVHRYSVNICLTGPGGSLDTARTMMEAAAVIVRAGGAGVFIDNSALAHGGEHWLDFTEDGGPDALSFAFVSIVRGKQDAYTMGMHVLGLPEIKMRRADIEPEGDLIIEVLRYMCRSDRPVDEGHLLVLEDGQTLQVIAKKSSDMRSGSPMDNPFGCLVMVPVKSIAEQN